MTTRQVDIKAGWQIKAGPSREELFDALRLYDEQRKVEFTLQAGMDDCDPWDNPNTYALQAQVQGISAEDGSGHSWILRLSFSGVNEKLELVNPWPFDVYYNDKRRHGSIMGMANLSTPL